MFPTPWRAVVLLIGVMLGMQVLGPELLRYETARIGHGEWWRLLSAHWVHANWTHFVMNMAGFALCLGLTGVGWGLVHWLWRMLALGFGISCAFWLWHPGINWYVGFSGVLYGLYALAAVDSWRRQPWMSFILLAFVVVKIVLEQAFPGDLTSSELIGVPVLVDAHLYGLVGAAVILAAQWIAARIRLNFKKVIDEN